MTAAAMMVASKEWHTCEPLAKEGKKRSENIRRSAYIRFEVLGSWQHKSSMNRSSRWYQFTGFHDGLEDIYKTCDVRAILV